MFIKSAVSYRFMVFPIEIKVHVALYFHEVIGDRELVIIQQFTFASILHLVGLASASLMEAFHKTVKRFVDCEVLEAVSHQCTVCQPCIGCSSRGLLASCLTVCPCYLEIIQNEHQYEFDNKHCDSFCICRRLPEKCNFFAVTRAPT